jgi:hypothetical protein
MIPSLLGLPNVIPHNARPLAKELFDERFTNRLADFPQCYPIIPYLQPIKLGEATGTQPKSLIRMFGPRGNPQARNLFAIIGYLQKQAGVELHVS